MTSGDGSTKSAGVPSYAAALQAAYGAPSAAGMGSAVFFERLATGADLEKAAVAKYRQFVGPSWERFGEKAWMGPWKQVHARPSGARPDVVAELRALEDAQARSSAGMLLEVVENAEKARAALAGAFDDPAVAELRVFNLGDGEAMSGLLVAGRRASGDATFLVFLMD
jgi:hypothetical protein